MNGSSEPELLLEENRAAQAHRWAAGLGGGQDALRALRLGCPASVCSAVHGPESYSCQTRLAVSAMEGLDGTVGLGGGKVGDPLNDVHHVGVGAMSEE